MKQIVASGMILHSPIEEFDPQTAFTYCRICGRVFQVVNTPEVIAIELRRDWSFRHARSHTATQHRQLEQSGLWVFSEAANRLAAFGVIPIKDLVLNDEIEHALLESTPEITEGLEHDAVL